MIHLGLTNAEKAAVIRAYCSEHGVRKVYVLSPENFAFDCGLAHGGAEAIEWAEIIKYRTFYRLLQEIDAGSLVVVNECLRTQNRYDLTYNCIRHFLAQAGHQIVFQWLPLIDDIADFMVLFDFDTRSRWKRERFDADLVRENAAVSFTARTPVFSRIPVAVDGKTRDAYAAEKAKLFANLGVKDPHTIPRNLYLVSGKPKLASLDGARPYVGRNNRFKLCTMQTYGEAAYSAAPYTVFELPHNFINFADFLALSGQREVPVLTADLPVDGWYFQRYGQWAERIADGYASLR